MPPSAAADSCPDSEIALAAEREAADPSAPAAAADSWLGAGHAGEAGEQRAAEQQGGSLDPACSSCAEDEIELLMRQLGLGGPDAGAASAAAGVPPVAESGGAGTSSAAPPPPPPAAAFTAPPAAGLDPALLSELCCPITQELMTDPVVAADGNTFTGGMRSRVGGRSAAGCSDCPCLPWPAACAACAAGAASMQSTAAYLPPACPSAAAWIERQQRAEQAPCSPLTNLPLEHLVLTTNRFMRSMIASMKPGAGG